MAAAYDRGLRASDPSEAGRDMANPFVGDSDEGHARRAAWKAGLHAGYVWHATPADRARAATLLRHGSRFPVPGGAL
jgi:hypothetical protein